MFDDLRNDSQSTQFSNDELENLLEPAKKKERKTLKLGAGGKIFGLNASQRFILSFLFLAVTCLGGMILLLVAERVMLF